MKQINQLHTSGETMNTDPCIEIVTVTPPLAAEWLTRNLKNRKVRFSQVNKLAHAFSVGQYILTGETVKFDVSDALIDGQHRLLAVIKADVAVRMIVVRGLPVEAYEIIDSGIKKTVGDRLGGLGVKNSNDLAAMAKFAIALRRGMNPNNTSALAEYVSDIDQQHDVTEHLNVYETAFRLATRTMFKRSAAGGLFVHLILSGFDAEDIDSFAEGVATGTDLGGTDCRLAVRNWLINRKANGRKTESATELEVLIRGWNAYAAGRPLKIVKSMARKGVEFPQVLCPKDLLDAAVS